MILNAEKITIFDFMALVDRDFLPSSHLTVFIENINFGKFI